MKIIIFVFLAFTSTFVFSMNFSGAGMVKLEGDIIKGDFKRFEKYLANLTFPPNALLIESNGGNLDEAIKIANLVNEAQLPIYSGTKCASACVFIYVAGVERTPLNQLGLHRPYYEKSYFSNLTSSQAKIKYGELELEAKNFLESMNVSDNIIERMFSTSSNNIDYITKEDAKTLLGSKSPFYEEWLLSKCGGFTDREEEVKSSLIAYKMLEPTVQYLKENPNSNHPNYSYSNLEYLKDKSKLAISLEKRGDLEVYKASIKIKETCLTKATAQHTNAFHKKLKKLYKKA